MIFIFLVVPLIGVLWYINFISFLKNLKNDKSTHNQTILGPVLTFIFIAALLFGIVGILDY